jgi:hypothetical protein
MISIISCSRSSNFNPVLTENISQTIGVAFEIITIDNSENKYSIFEAYNLGAKQCKYHILCFIHDDVLIHTSGWGEVVCNHFQEKNTGAIGIAGGKYLAYMPGTWWSSGYWEQNIIHSSKEREEYKLDAVITSPGSRSEVVAIDGVWFCVRKDLFDRISFDENTFKGFHFYDLDISLQVLKAGYKIFCVFDILIEHFSKGSYSKDWIGDALLFQEKWRDKLPTSQFTLNQKERDALEVSILHKFIDVCKQHLPEDRAYRLGLKYLFKYRNGKLILTHLSLIYKFLKKSIPAYFTKW